MWISIKLSNSVKTMKVKNTKNEGILRFFIYREKDHYMGVCLDLNIVEVGKDLDDLKKSIIEAAFGYIQVVNEHNLSDEHLNKPAPKAYWRKYYKHLEFLNKIESLKRESAKIKAVQKAPESAKVGFPFVIPISKLGCNYA